MSLHADELDVDISLVRTLLARTLPAYADRPLAEVRSAGSTNRIFRLGDAHAVRLPRQPGGGAALLKEQRWTPVLAEALTVAVPRVVDVLEPGVGYPEPWALTTWCAGVRPEPPAPGEPPRLALAADLATLIVELRRCPVPDPVPDDLHSYRGEPLAAFDPAMRGYLDQCRDLPDVDLDLDAVGRVWDAAVDDVGPMTPAWLHGDLLAENLLVDADGRLTALLDVGGVAVGDPTVDLAVAWELLDPVARDALRSALDVDDPTWRRARAWTLALAVMTLPYYGRTMPERVDRRLAMARAALADATAQ